MDTERQVPFLATKAVPIDAIVEGRTAVTEARPETSDDVLPDAGLAQYSRTAITKERPETSDDEIP